MEDPLLQSYVHQSKGISLYSKRFLVLIPVLASIIEFKEAFELSSQTEYIRVVATMVDPFGKLSYPLIETEVTFRLVASKSLKKTSLNDFFPQIEGVHQSAMRKREEIKQSRAKEDEINSKLESQYYPNRLHHDIFSLDESFLDDDFVRAIKSNRTEDLEALLSYETNSKVVSFPLFKPEFCKKLVEEMENIKRLQASDIEAPNSMNKEGLFLDRFGFGYFLDQLIEKYLSKLTTILYYEWGGGHLDYHHGFVVEYEIGKDIQLDYHMDSSEVTLNVLLLNAFEGGSLFFQGVRDTPSEGNENFEFKWSKYSPGTAILHVGQHWHGAYPITSGERKNFILWMRSSEFRSSSTEKFIETCQSDHQQDVFLSSKEL
jgi:hypothetical protein